eukprot:1158573-Pelagomonas_calceolata.AAC.8
MHAVVMHGMSLPLCTAHEPDLAAPLRPCLAAMPYMSLCWQLFSAVAALMSLTWQPLHAEPTRALHGRPWGVIAVLLESHMNGIKRMSLIRGPT